MAAVDYVEMRLEETPIWTNADTSATPYRLATEKLYLPVRSARLSANPSHLRRSDELRGLQAEPVALVETFEPAGSLSVRAYAKELVWLLTLAGWTMTYTAGGATTTGPAKTTATGVNALNSATVNVASTADFATSGTFILGGVATTYTGKTSTSFTGCGNHAATTGGETINDNVPVGAAKWVATKRDAIDAQTAQIAINHKDESVLLKGNGYGVSSLNMTATGEVSADLVGLWLRRLAVDSSTVPSYATQTIPPFRRGELSLAWLTGGGRPSDFSFAIANSLERVYDLSLTPPTAFPNALEYGDGQVQVTGSIPKRSLDADDYDALLAATTFAATARWKSATNIGATSYPYQLWLEMPSCQYLSGDSEDMGNKRRVGASYDFFAAYDETLGYDAKITIVNATTSIATYP